MKTHEERELLHFQYEKNLTGLEIPAMIIV